MQMMLVKNNDESTSERAKKEICIDRGKRLDQSRS